MVITYVVTFIITSGMACHWNNWWSVCCVFEIRLTYSDPKDPQPWFCLDPQQSLSRQLLVWSASDRSETESSVGKTKSAGSIYMTLLMKRYITGKTFNDTSSPPRIKESVDKYKQPVAVSDRYLMSSKLIYSLTITVLWE